MRLAPLILALALLSAPASATADEAIWGLLKSGGQVVIMRHAATVPNVSDSLGPGGCTVQRNLSEAGREDARRIGDAFRARGIVVEDVRVSVWCITALTGLFPTEGEMLVLTPRGDGFTVAGRLKPSDVSAN
jgi:hypothetical protein